LTKNGSAIFWAIFSQTHLVTLLGHRILKLNLQTFSHNYVLEQNLHSDNAIVKNTISSQPGGIRTDDLLM
jgi:hypothetical protein